MPRAPPGFVRLTLLVQGSGSTVPVAGSRFPALVQRSQRGRVKARANSRFHETASGSRPPENLESAPAQIVTTSRTLNQNRETGNLEPEPLNLNLEPTSDSRSTSIINGVPASVTDPESR